MRVEEPILGACLNSDNPDLWFPDLGRGGDSRSDARITRKAKEIDLALAICKSCDKKAECLEEGMKPENINFGIWGGLLSGERLISVGVKTGDYHPFSEQGMSLHLYNRVAPYLRR
jgi:hypothetical protein